ncbi:nitroreductase family deazaflavin-dependent oxidoreductase [Streptomyces griseoluteus]|uniref:nitroreductase family deazaflavin-dependent oxidoreductase n=1 Tax=Streptomyces griseoluteus TaxID=29306 RepID=UPI0036FDF7DF
MPHRQIIPVPSQPATDCRGLAGRLRICAFRVGLGRLLGRRLLLHHTGRLSGLDRRAVLDVVECDPEAGTWVVASWFGTGADWYRNLRAQPKTVIEVGSRHYAVTAAFLTPGEGAGGGRPRAGGAACLVRLDTGGGHRRR